MKTKKVQSPKVKPMAGNHNYADLLVKLERERIQAELEEIAHLRMLRAVEAGQYVKKEDVAQVCVALGKRMKLRQKLCVVLVSPQESQAVHRFLRAAPLLPRARIIADLTPLMQGL